MTLLDVQEKLLTCAKLPVNWDQQGAEPPSKTAIETAWRLAKFAVTRFQLNPTDCVPSSDGGVALVWVHPTNHRYADMECCNDNTVRACISSQEHSMLEEWQIEGYGLPVIGEKHRSLDDSFKHTKQFLQFGMSR